MSNTNRVSFRAVKEAAGSYGIIPLTPDLTELCVTGASGLAFAPETVTSEKIRSDRQIDDLVLVGGEASGDLGSELAFDIQDFLMEGAFFNLYQVRPSRSNRENTPANVGAVTGGADFAVLDDGTGVPIQNDIIRGEGFDVAGNNAYHIDDGASTTTSFSTTSAVAEGTPPLQARLNVVGHRSDGAGDLVLTITGSTGTLASTATDLSLLGVTLGDWIALDEFPDNSGANEGFYRVSLAPTPTLLTFDIVPVGSSNETPAGLGDIYVGDRLINGVLFQSYTLEEEFDDHTPITYQYFRGMAVDGMVLTAPSQSIVTLTYTFAGKDAFFSENGDVAPADKITTPDAAGRPTGFTEITSLPLDVMNSSSDVARIARGGTPISGENFVLEATVEIANNLRPLNAVGFLGAINLGVGEFGVTGSLNTYFDTSALARDVISNTETSFDARFEDSAEHALVLDAPRIKFSEGAPEVASKNEDVVINLAYQAIRHPTFGYTLLLQRFKGFRKSN